MLTPLLYYIIRAAFLCIFYSSLTLTSTQISRVDPTYEGFTYLTKLSY
jgi:hypothetical protein